MLKIDFSNIEEIVFQNEKIHHKFPAYFSNYFQQWKLGKQFPFLNNLAKRTTLDLLNELDSIPEILHEIFGENVTVEKLNYNIVQHVKVPLKNQDLCCALCKIVEFNYFSTWRDDEYLYISFWR